MAADDARTAATAASVAADRIAARISGDKGGVELHVEVDVVAIEGATMVDMEFEDKLNDCEEGIIFVASIAGKTVDCKLFLVRRGIQIDLQHELKDK